jgi:hypothetical protein
LPVRNKRAILKTKNYEKNLILIAAALLVSGISATAQRVILRISSNHEVSIDGNYYDYNETVPALSLAHIL